MNTIWKFPLTVDDIQWLELPRGYKVLSVGVQHETPCLWVQVDSQAVTDSIMVVTTGTGHPMRSAEMQFIGTYQLDGGDFVGHVFIPK